MTVPPDAGLVAPIRSEVEPVVNAEEWIHAAGVGGIGVIDGAVIECERAHAGSVAVISGHVNTARGRESAFRRVATTLLAISPAKYVARRPLVPVVVFGALALLLLRDPNAELGVEVAAKRRGPGKRPPHPLLVRLQFWQRRARDR